MTLERCWIVTVTRKEIIRSTHDFKMPSSSFVLRAATCSDTETILSTVQSSWLVAADSGVARGATGAMPPKLLVIFCVQWIYVVTFFECVSRPVSAHKWRVISRSPWNVQKMSRNRGHFLDLDVQLPPPPANLVCLRRTRNISATKPPPHRIWSASGDHAKSTGWPPQQKSWLRRRLLINLTLNWLL